ncbi:hypothetical protein ARMSODRAFT_1013036 [Armillaria solidipes]|uniref:Uncharacterized protein n=1 Tax=Armillaria solidipes TaxID=1076256 RepID=A0A2H3CJV8_9AGAR|nr:hypothetical protein ARMSODRAFT_1013036 [Armillaria solidipes]
MQSKIIWRAFMLIGAFAPVFVSSSPVPLRAGAESYSLDTFARNSQTQVKDLLVERGGCLRFACFHTTIDHVHIRFKHDWCTD